MDVGVAGAHGQVARRLTRRLASRGDRVRGIIRSAHQADDLRQDGGEPIVVDLEQAAVANVAEAIDGCDAVVFAAGAGPGSGARRKETVDYGAAVKLIEATRIVGVSRYVMVSSMGADHPPGDDDVFSVYLRAKARADQALVDSGLGWTILRPGRLTDDQGTGTVMLDEHVDRGDIPRDDVAAVLAAVLDTPRTAGRILEVVSGSTPIDDAVVRLVT
ncbi:MAG: NAD(P)H-binding protein [Nitriliruptorales bacterium]|nr:NAD(P)H-binding protein [Nitriliruptorales bacterium]